MSRLAHKRRNQPISEMNVVPYIDVMLVLVIIFMITAPLMQQGVKVDLPRTQASKLASPEHPIVITLDAKQRLHLDLGDGKAGASKYYSQINMLAAIKAALAKAKQAVRLKQVYLRADKSLPYGQVVATMSALQKAGVEHVGLITDPTHKV